MIENTPLTQRVESLVARGGSNEALALLEHEVARGEADACHILAVWRLSGRWVARDLSIARALFDQAGAEGRLDSQAIYIALLANGTGGERCWANALVLLSNLAKHDAAAQKQCELLESMVLTSDGDPVHPAQEQTIVDSPNISFLRHFLTEAECTYLMDAAQSYLGPATVFHPTTGKLIRDPIRTSDVAVFPLALENPAIHALNRRMAAASNTDVSQGEPLQILRYEQGQQYKLHSDALNNVQNQRTRTMLCYLNEAFEGGETSFPAANLAIRAGTGDAILFRNTRSDGLPDERAFHAGLPVRTGTKYVASRWIRASPLDLFAQ